MRARYCDQRYQEADWERHGGYCDCEAEEEEIATIARSELIFNYIACSSFEFDAISITENVQCDKH